MIRRRGAIVLGAVVAVTALLSGGAGAQRGGMRSRASRGGRSMRGGVAGAPARSGRPWGYDSSRETPISGVAVDSPWQAVGSAISAMDLRTTEGEVRRVQLGPGWYLDHVGLEPQSGDSVVVLGMPLEPQGSGEIIAREVEWRGQSYRLRGEEGGPLWAGASQPYWLQYGNLWNPYHRETITGEICALESMNPIHPGMVAGGRTTMARGEALQVAMREGSQQVMRVHLGPAWLVSEELPDLQLGQDITVTGSRGQAMLLGPVLLAEEVEMGEHRVRLRAENGRPAWAGGWQNWDGWGPGSRYGRMYDPQRVRSISGVAERTDMESPWENIGIGLLLTVRTRDQEQVRAHVGPLWFVQQAGIDVAPGDEVTVTGSMMGAAGEEAMMVRELEMEQQQITLREADGVPVWIGRGPGGA